ncbi:hypothetical protein GUITHDRAFT_145083 [Guillardia theta CCMP2712]|uniref:Uncharacterized protein n=1 Tax=Guillardia theta (strain CCMP2712) TaxID=905079 RepID=L1IM88_GUITC|nr:hypothetical protein GUITHDRAFT_145083 [Guillardia theta CCMP2712]EKX37388.1 hypothetical protein GUITHDRAFT_145083 [Guillardia theta CCMP2712]|eukprot:XP_005824368.1 hypothetical protein GUITHDRAFT_145083 [Guillardia theta CCMP2712]
MPSLVDLLINGDASSHSLLAGKTKVGLLLTLQVAISNLYKVLSAVVSWDPLRSDMSEKRLGECARPSKQVPRRRHSELIMKTHPPASPARSLRAPNDSARMTAVGEQRRPQVMASGCILMQHSAHQMTSCNCRRCLARIQSELLASFEEARAQGHIVVTSQRQEKAAGQAQGWRRRDA